MKKPTHEVDEYLSPDFYKKNSNNSENGFEAFEHDGAFYFCYYVDGKVTLLSQAYASAAARNNGIASVKKNMKLEKRYRFTDRKKNKFGFALRAGNHQEIAKSCDFASAALATDFAGKLRGAKFSQTQTPKTQAAKTHNSKLSVPESGTKKPYASNLQPSKIKAKTGQSKNASVKKKASAKKTSVSKVPAPSGLSSAPSVSVSPPLAKRALTPPPVLEKAPIAPKFPIAARVPVTAKRPSLASDIKPRPSVRVETYGNTSPSRAPAYAKAQSTTDFRWLLWALPLMLILGGSVLGYSSVTSMTTLSNPAKSSIVISAGDKFQEKVKSGIMSVKTAEVPKALKTDTEIKMPTKQTSTETQPSAPLPTQPTASETKRAQAALIPASNVRSGQSSGLPFNISACGTSENILFNVSPDLSVMRVTDLTSRIEFGDVHDLSPVEFYDKLTKRFLTRKYDQQYLDFVFRSMGYEKGFKDATPQMFSDITLTQGAKGVLGYGDIHGMQVVKLNVAKTRDLEAFNIKSANNKNVSFMKTSGSFMHICR